MVLIVTGASAADATWAAIPLARAPAPRAIAPAPATVRRRERYIFIWSDPFEEFEDVVTFPKAR